MPTLQQRSGSAAHLEMVRSMGQMLQRGWKPRRTIVFASWDGEEYGLLGSTEYVEQFPKFISKDVVAYINMDSGVYVLQVYGRRPSV